MLLGGVGLVSLKTEGSWVDRLRGPIRHTSLFGNEKLALAKESEPTVVMSFPAGAKVS